MRDQFWSRWKREYLQQLIPRTKWKEATAKYTPGQLCLILNENMPPAKWPLARIAAVHPGSDGLVRVVTVKTATSTFKRPIAKLVLLPVLTAASEEESGL
jgi:NAD(P)H-hydrate repair Nnr-like enzyme with NAD(P)H-hydrate dehydratase domain